MRQQCPYLSAPETVDVTWMLFSKMSSTTSMNVIIFVGDRFVNNVDNVVNVKCG